MLTGESSKRVEDSVEDQRAGFVHWLLNADGSNTTTVVDFANSSAEMSKSTHVEETNFSSDIDADPTGSMYIHFYWVYSKENVVIKFLADGVACFIKT